jgi:hypothetical protein
MCNKILRLAKPDRESSKGGKLRILGKTSRLVFHLTCLRVSNTRKITAEHAESEGFLFIKGKDTIDILNIL